MRAPVHMFFDVVLFLNFRSRQCVACRFAGEDDEEDHAEDGVHRVQVSEADRAEAVQTL